MLRLAVRAGTLTIFFVYLLALYRGTPWLSDPTTVGSDVSNYYAAGQRLNDGHDLYRLRADDLPVPVLPPISTVPLISPPPVGVVWRPLALLPRDAAITAWWAVAALAMVVTTVWFTGLGSLVVTLGVLALSTELAITALSANLNAWLVGALAGVWLARRADRPGVVGALVAISVAVKVLPIVLVVWLIVGRRWMELAWFVGVSALIGMISLVGAGLAAHLDWFEIARYTGTSGVAPASVPGVLQALGTPSFVVSAAIPLTVVAGVTAIMALRHRPGPAFTAAIITIVLANPAVHDGSYALLLPALLPWARPIKDGQSETAAAD